MYLIEKLIGIGQFLAVPHNWYLMFLVVMGITAIIFFHELGHFLVARLCGVRCDKFYVGFGKPLVKFQWGETEYGLGMIPLGGYVKMLGQDDNPGKAAEEMERAKTGEGPALDPRSYLAKSVPQRMAIISAGVAMNVIFAFVVATATYYWFEVRYLPCVVSGMAPGDAAWKHGVQVGDRILRIGDKEMTKFRDLRAAIMLGDIENGIDMTVERPGPDGPREVDLRVYPNRKGLAPMIGVGWPRTTALADKLPDRDDTSAARTTPPLEGGDRIVAVDGQPVETYADLHAILADSPNKKLALTIARKNEDTKDAEDEKVTVHIDPNPVKELGLVMKWGKITAIRHGSPADAETAAGEKLLQEGDLILNVNDDDELTGDPLTFPEQIRQLGSNTVQITVQRNGEQKTVDLTLRPSSTFESPMSPGGPISVPSMGIAYEVFNIVQSVTENSPAAGAGLKAGDHIEWVKLVPSKAGREYEEPYGIDKVPLDDDNLNWAYFAQSRLQLALDDSKVQVKPKGRDPVELVISKSTKWFNPDRGLRLAPLQFPRSAESFGEAVSLGAAETWEQLTLIFRGLRAIGRGQVSAKSISSPVKISEMAFEFAKGGWSTYLIFLTMLSANLAVINFLPIPVLDGGHMVFLAYEGIRGKPPSERLIVGAMYAGLAFLLSVMLFAVMLDVGIIARE